MRAVVYPHGVCSRTTTRFKKDFGKTIVGFFYDEPETQGDWGRDMLTLAAERKLDLDRLMVAYKFKLAGEELRPLGFTDTSTFLRSRGDARCTAGWRNGAGSTTCFRWAISWNTTCAFSTAGCPAET
jgi:hypothetical protein